MKIDVLTEVIKIASNSLGIDASSIKEDSSFTDDLKADSLDVVEIVMSMEDKFGVEIGDDVAGKIRTIKDAVEYIESRLASK